ncbi:MAG: PAS domain S-box protein [Desulfomonilaceae bacterium]
MGISKLLALLLVPAYVVVIGVLDTLEIKAVFEPPLLLLVLNTLFLGIVPVAVAYIAARVYLMTGSSSIFLTGCGMLTFGLCTIPAGGLVEMTGGPNLTVTIHNTGALVGGFFLAMGSILNLVERKSPDQWGTGKQKVATAYGCVGILVVIFVFVTVKGLVPSFFIQGVGPTILSQVVLATAVILFILSSAFFMHMYAQWESDFLYWYSFGLALIAIGLCAIFLQTAVGSPIGWLGRSAQYLGGVFSLVAIVTAWRSARSKGLPIERIIANFLADAEASYRDLVESARDAIISFDQEGRIIGWNSAAEVMFGHAKGDAIGWLFFDLLIPEQHGSVFKAEFEAVVAQPKKSLSARSIEIEGKRRDSSVFPVEVSVSARELPTGRVTTCIIRDVTEHKKAEEELREQTHLNQVLLDAFPCVALLLHPQTRQIVASNAAAVEVGAVPGARCFSTWGQRENPCPWCLAPEAWATGEARHLEVEGLGIVWDAHWIPVGPDLYMHYAFDVTDRKKAEKALRREQIFTGALLENMVDGVVACDADFKLALFNRTAREWHGLDARAVPAEKWADYYDLYCADGITPMTEATVPLARAFRGEVLRDGGMVIRAKGQPVRHILANCATFFDETGTKLGAVGVMHDITERKRAEEELQKQVSLMESLLEAIPAPVFFKDTNHIYLGCNKAFAELLGLPKENVIGKSVHEVAPIELADVYRTQDEALFKNPIPQIYETSVKSSDGTTHDVIFHKATFADSSGAVAGLIGVILDITDRKKAEEALRDSEERFRSAMEAANDGVWDWDLKTDHVFRSPGFFSMLGYGDEEFSGRFQEWQNLVHPEDLKAVIQTLNEYLNGTRGNYEVEFRMFHKSGGTVWILSRGKVMARDANGEPLRMLGTHTDITERKISEELIRIRLELLEFAASHSLEELLQKTLDVVGSLTDSPIGFYHFISEDEKTISLQAWSTRTVNEFCQAEGKGRHYPVDQAGVWVDAVRERRPMIHNDYATLPHRKGMPEGHAIVIRELVVPIMRSGRIVGILGIGNKPSDYTENDVKVVSYLADVAWEITKRKRAEEALRENEEKYRTLFADSIDALFIVAADGTLLGANQAYFDLVGGKKEERLGHSVLRAYADPADRPPYLEALAAKGFVRDYPLRLVGKDGRQIDCLISSRVERDKDGNILGSRGFIRDITEQKNLQRQLLQSQKMEAIGTLSGGIAHDFNNLLTVVMGFSELLLAEKDRKHPEYADLQKIFHAARSGAELVQRLLMFSRKSEPKPVPMNLNKRIVQVEKLLRRTIPKMIDVKLELSADLPQINADPSQVEQVIMNLAVNARDAMPDKGKLTLRTDIVTLDEDYCRLHLEANPRNYVLLEISDTGQGMDKETAERIFEPFFTTKEMGRGTGLGLAMVFGIIKQHNGHITVYSEVGIGTTFSVYLPAIPAEVEPEVEDIGIMPAFGTETVLLVDDEEFVRELGARILTKHGFTVLQAVNGREGLDLFKKERSQISLVVLDLIMPEMGGTECLKELLKIDPKVKILIASGFSADASIRETIQMGAKGFVNKPFRVKEFLRDVRKVLDES